MIICTRPMRSFIFRTSIGGLSRSVCFLRSWAGRSSGVPPDLFIKKRCSLPCHPEPPSFGEQGPGRAVRMPRVLCEVRNRTFGAHPYGRTAPGPRLYCLAPGQRRHCGACGMSCAETLAGEAIGGYRLKTPASQIASYSSQETELAALVSRKSFCILLWPLRGDQVSSGRDGTSRLPAICCLLSNKWPVGALISPVSSSNFALAILPSSPLSHPYFRRLLHCVWKMMVSAVRSYKIWCFIP